MYFSKYIVYLDIFHRITLWNFITVFCMYWKMFHNMCNTWLFFLVYFVFNKIAILFIKLQFLSSIQRTQRRQSAHKFMAEVLAKAWFAYLNTISLPIHILVENTILAVDSKIYHYVFLLSVLCFYAFRYRKTQC